MTAVADRAVSVVVVDDQLPFRLAAKSVVRMTPGFELSGEAASGEEALETVASLHPDLVLMDINMGGIDGLEATSQIVSARPETLVVLVSTYTLEQLPPHARSCGAGAYLNKDELSPRAVRRIWADGGDDSWRRVAG
jgi:two-component system, NarL family, invasion response regulator UvrY